MRVKQLFARVPVPDKVKLVYARLTLNKLTTLYFVVAIIHCILQVVFQLAAHAINVNARHLVSHILQQAKLTMDKFALVDTRRRAPQAPEELTLTICRGIPGQFGLTGKDVCNALWSQSRGLVNDTVKDFLSPSSESDGEESDSDSDSEDDKKSTPIPQLASTSSIVSSTRTTSRTLSAIPSTLPLAVAPSSSSSPATTSIKSTASVTSTGSPTTTSFASSISKTTSVSVSQTGGLVAPTDVANLIKPDSASSDSNSDSASSDDEGGLVAVLSRRSAQRTRGERKVFDREKIRPLSLPPRPRTPSPSSTEIEIDIDETHPDLRAHSRRARVAPMTSSLLARSREGLMVEFVPIAPRVVADPKRFVSSRSKRGGVKSGRRSLFGRGVSAQDQRDVTVTPIFEVEAESDGDKKKAVVGMNAITEPKSKLVAVKVAGLLGPGMGDPSPWLSNTTGSLASGTSELAATSGEVELSPGCALALAWPGQVLRDFEREDLAMIGFQAWLLGMSVVAILNESVPHLIAGLFTQTLSTGWSAFQMARSSSFKAEYETAIVRGACAGVDVLPDYFNHRTEDEIPIVVLNGIFLVVTALLSWRMCRVYGWQTFKRIGASQVMNQAYRLVLAFSIHLQLAVFFFVVSSAMWVDELLNGPVACFAQHRSIYEGIFITSVLLLLPWLVLGWIGVRRENKHMMHAFLLISLLYVTAWGAMFASDVYRWTFATWPFFAVMTVVSYIVVVATTGLAVVCRYNFKKGLALFLQSQQTLPEADFSSAMPDPEKVEFPTHRAGQAELPTFSVAFGQGGRPQPPAQMFPSRSALASGPAQTQSPGEQAGTLPPAGYSVNPYATSSDFWGDRDGSGDVGYVRRNESVRSKRSADRSEQDMVREAVDAGVPRYSIHDDGPFSDVYSDAQSQESLSLGRQQRELPQWEEVRRSQVPHLSRLDLHPHPQPQADRTSIYSAATGTTGTTGTGQYEVLRDGQWQRVDARELYRTSLGGVTHASGFSGASWVPGDDAQLPTAPPPPVPSIPPFVSSMPIATRPPAAASRAFVGLPGKNVKPQTSNSGRVTQQFSPPRAGVLGGSAVPQGW